MNELLIQFYPRRYLSHVSMYVNWTKLISYGYCEKVFQKNFCSRTVGWGFFWICAYYAVRTLLFKKRDILTIFFNWVNANRLVYTAYQDIKLCHSIKPPSNWIKWFNITCRTLSLLFDELKPLSSYSFSVFVMNSSLVLVKNSLFWLVVLSISAD